jgi:hypothetical protein
MGLWRNVAGASLCVFAVARCGGTALPNPSGQSSRSGAASGTGVSGTGAGPGTFSGGAGAASGIGPAAIGSAGSLDSGQEGASAGNVFSGTGTTQSGAASGGSDSDATATDETGAPNGSSGSDATATGDDASPASASVLLHEVDGGGTCTVAQVCSIQEQPIPPISSQDGQAALVARLVGDWALCESTSVFGTHEAGLSIAADGSWYKMYASGARLVSGQGFGDRGSWSIIDTSNINGPSEPFQLQFQIDGSGVFSTFPAFAMDPRKMRLSNDGITADYVIDTCPPPGVGVSASDAAVTDGPVVLPGADGGMCLEADICSMQAQSTSPITEQDGQAALVARMVGDWALCDATSVFGTDEAGLSIAADGTWYKLYASGGRLVRQQGFDWQGTWEVIDTSSMNGPTNPFQLDFVTAGGALVITHPTFADYPREMRLSDEGAGASGIVADYVADVCPP